MTRPSLRGPFLSFLWLLGLALSASSCEPPRHESGEGADDRHTASLRAVATLPPLAYILDRIGGERVETMSMVPQGAAPETFEPGVRQLGQLAQAQLLFRVGMGLPLEEKHLVPLALERRVRIVAMSEAAAEVLDLLAQTEGQSSSRESKRQEGDVHLWLSPLLVRRSAREITAVLSELDPPGRALYFSNLQRLEKDINQLDASIRSTLASRSSNRIFVQHPAWYHFARQYGLQQIAIEQNGKEPSPKQLIELISQARANGCHVIFAERSASAAGARALANEVGAEIQFLDPIAYDWLESLRTTAAAFAAALGSENIDTPD